MYVNIDNFMKLVKGVALVMMLSLVMGASCSDSANEEEIVPCSVLFRQTGTTECEVAGYAFSLTLDLTAPAGSVVKAVMDGTVIFAGWSEDAGNTIQIQHESDIVSIYKHNEKLLKKVGEKVTAGSPIALVGNTGSQTTGAHLHFELWHKGETVDPTLYIKF